MILLEFHLFLQNKTLTLYFLAVAVVVVAVVAIVAVVGGGDEGLQFGHIVGVSKVDHVDGDVVPPQAFAEHLALLK